MKLAIDGLVMLGGILPAHWWRRGLLRQLSLANDLRRYFREPAEAHPWARRTPAAGMKERLAHTWSHMFLRRLRSDGVPMQPPHASVGKQGCLWHVLRPRNLARGPCLLMEEGQITVI